VNRRNSVKSFSENRDRLPPTDKRDGDMKRKHTTRALVAVIALASMVTLTLSGCVSVRGGQSEHDASNQIRSVPGLSSGEVSVSNSYNGFQKVTLTAARVTVKPNYVVKNPAALVDYLIRVAWSANQSKPNQMLGVNVDSTQPFDAAAAAKSAGWKSAKSLAQFPAIVSIDLKEVKKRLGDWPGKVPAPSSGAGAMP
jgi:hypothetical protein